MIGIADTAAFMVDGEKVKAITEEDRNQMTEVYTDVYDSISAFKKKNDFAYIYIVVNSGELDQDGHEKYVFIVDADEETPSEYGEEIVYTEALEKAAHGKSAMDDKASADKWGSFYSAFSPIYDNSNNIVGVGGVSIKDRFRSPDKDICNVLGIGVADRVKTSILFFNSLIFSLCLTPNLCSSSITSKPKSLNEISSLNNLCVPIKISILPSLVSSIILLALAGVTKRLSKATRTGNDLNLSRALS